jgi:ABC-2 type transport system ATP-binding protein
MAQIQLREISKSFRVAERPEGRFGVLRGFFVRKHRIIKALDSISFDIGEGELVGYIGPNGAGKSTTVKIMSGILTPDSGSCSIMGRIPWGQRVRHVSQIGVVFGQRSQLWWDVPVSDSFDLLKDVYSLPVHDFRLRLSELSSALEISGLLKTPVRQLSLGQRVRCEIAAALLHRPKILFLDEPTIGLDALTKLALRDFLRKENREHGTTMILTTHDMDDIESLCSRVMVIGHGRLLYDGGLEELKKRYSTLHCIRATLDRYVEGFEIDGAESMDVNANIWSVWFDPSKIASYEMIKRLSQVLPIRDIIIKEQDIEEIIAAMYRDMCI